MSDPKKKITNPLFSNAVTGGTVEDFSQNALLLPAKEKPAAPSVQPLIFDVAQENFDIEPNQQQNIQQLTYQQQQFTLNPSPTYYNQQPQTQQINLLQEPQTSNLSTVFSSFSNILKLNKSDKNALDDDYSVPPPAGIETILNQEPSNAEPVPLFPSSGINVYAPSAPPQRPVNSFRRSGLKKPVYAQPPGLSSSCPQPPQNGLGTLQYETGPPLQHQTGTVPLQYQTGPPIQPQTASVPLQCQTGPPLLPHPPPSQFFEPAAPNAQHFKPISPEPNTFLNPVTIPQKYTPNTGTLFTPQTVPVFQSPVMAAIPASEVLQTSDNLRTTNANIGNEEKLTNQSPLNQIYRPVYHHWFYKKEIEGKVIWQPFSMVDSLALEQAFTSNDIDPDQVVATEGGRYDVNILRRQRNPVYWKGSSTEVRRCSWFHKSTSDGRFTPYEENIATKLEEEYKNSFEGNKWHKNIELPNEGTVVFHAPDVLVLLPPAQTTDTWGNGQTQSRPKIVKRGMDEFDVDEGEPSKVDHLLFMVHGIGSVCDLKFRTVEEVVDEFRGIALQLVQSHYKSSCEGGIANRIEVLPISWHDKLHSEDTGIDRKLKSITLESIPRLRDFTNDTLLDILCYTSPAYCQTIISTVGNQINKTYELFKQRNPDFNGGVSLGGHSLGSLILFDLLCHQHPECDKEPPTDDQDVVAAVDDSKPPPLSRRISYMMSTAGTGQAQLIYPHLAFQPTAFFALGSPIGMFVTVRGLDNLGEQFSLPTCPAFFNIFHPYDPVAYRIESLVNPDLTGLKPVLIPHHKGRKRMHLELKETMSRVGADLKQKVMDSMKSTWNSFYQLAMFHRPDQPSLEEEVDKAFKQQLSQTEDFENEEPEQQQTNLPLGLLNKHRRIDYVLQEAPFEFFNEYLFALTSHVCYWESEDTILLILKEIYSSMNISTDDKIPQQSMTIERPLSSPKTSISTTNDIAFGMDPTAPPQHSSILAPPPISGFVKKT